MRIAIDGPAGSGKSTIAREVAKRLHMRYLDTGAMYRTVTLLAMEAGLVPDRIKEAGALAATVSLRLVERADDLTRVFVGEREVTDEIRGRAVSQNVSAVSADAGVRAVLTQKQRQEAAEGGVVLEGRDMGTVVVPDAEVKVYLTASIQERARRRQLQLQAQGVDQPLEELIVDITARDAYDSERELAPLRKADDAVEIDTSGMSIPEVVAKVCALAQQATPKKYLLSRMLHSPLDTVLYRIAHIVMRRPCFLLFRMEVTGVEHIPRTGAVVVAANHRSQLDPFFIGICAPRQIHYMAKAELWDIPGVGWALEKIGTFPVKRGEADRRAVKFAYDLLDNGSILGLFPEGHRQRGVSLGAIQPGVSLFSLRGDAVTIPVVLEGTDRVVKHGIVRFPKLKVTFGPPLQIPGGDLPRGERMRLTTTRLVDAFKTMMHLPPETE